MRTGLLALISIILWLLIVNTDLKQLPDNLRWRNSLRGAETVEISARLGNYSASRYIRNDRSQSVIVFVHGVLGDGTSTWTAKNKSFWPEMLKQDVDFKDFDIYVYEYPTALLVHSFSIGEIAENMRLLFDVDRVSTHKDITFLAHSMGGLVTRAYLLSNRDSASRTRLIYFFSTPTTGSSIASIVSLVSGNPQLAQMQAMRSEDYLGEQQRQWLSVNPNIPSFCAYETVKTYGIHIVVPQASAASLCNKRLDPINEDHFTIVKPSSVGAPSYLAFKAAVNGTSSPIPQETHGRQRPLVQEVQGGAKIIHESSVPPPSQARGVLRIKDIRLTDGYSTIAPGKRFAINLYFSIPGPEPIFNVYTRAGASVEDVKNGEFLTDRRVRLRAEMELTANYEQYIAGNIIGFPEMDVDNDLVTFTTLITPPLTQSEVDGIHNGTKRIYFVSWHAWTDSQGHKYFLYDCRWIQAHSLPDLVSVLCQG